MKRKNLIIGLSMMYIILTFVSCSESTSGPSGDIEGIYYGSFTRTSSLKATSEAVSNSNSGDEYAEIHRLEGNQIQVHCFGEEIDTTFMLDYYMHNDSVLVCLTGDDFENMYGHMLGAGHMGGGMMGGNMMGDIGDNETEWMHHMSDEHEEGDEHFGGFDMQNGMFTYFIRMTNEAEPYYMKFTGSKEE